MKAIAYYRVSGREQQKKKTIASQKREVHKFAKQMGYTLVDEFEDDGKEGGLIENRPGFQSTLRAIEEGRAQVLLVTFLNRIGRLKKLADRNRVVELFEACKVNVHAAIPRPDGTLYEWNNEEDIETLRKELWQSRKENIQRGEMVRLGLEERRLRGAPVGRLPYALLYDEETETYSYEPKKSASLKVIIQLLTKGWGLPRLAKALNGDLKKYPPPGSKGEWEETAIHQIVNNDFYFTAAIHSIKADVEPQQTGLKPLFTKEEIERARREMSIRHKRSGIVNRADYLLHGLLKCGECGKSMGPHPRKRASGRITRYYRCRGKNRYGKDFCSQNTFRADELEDMVWTIVLNMVENGKDLEQAIMDEEFIPDTDRDKLKDLAAGAKRDLAKLEERLQKIKDLYEWGDDDKATYDAKKERIKKEQIEAEELLRKTVEQLEMPAEKKALIMIAVQNVADEVKSVTTWKQILKELKPSKKSPDADQEHFENDELLIDPITAVYDKLAELSHFERLGEGDKQLGEIFDWYKEELISYLLDGGRSPTRINRLIKEQKSGILWQILGNNGFINVKKDAQGLKITLEGDIRGKRDSNKMLNLKSLRIL